MKISIETAKLNELIDIATRFVAKNATLPILQNLYFKASIDSLIMRATDMEKYIEIEMPCVVALEWAITVNAKTFSDIIKTIEEKSMEINVDPKSSIMTIKSSKDTFEINWISSSEYVALPDVPRDNIILLDWQNFSNWIKKVEFAVTEKSFSPILTWVLIKSKKEPDWNKLIFVWSDSFRLAEYKIEIWNDLPDFSLIIPKLTIGDIEKIAEYWYSNESEEIKIQFSENLIAFEMKVKDTKILATSLLIQWSFPEYDREEIMPKNFNTKILVDKNECEKAIKKIWILTRDINNFIQIETNKTEIIISSGKTDKGAWSTSIPAIIEWWDITLWINGRYITDFIRIMSNNEVLFNIVDNQKPLIISEKNDNNYKYVVRPLLNN